jgi:hypothetical protein
MFQLVDGGEVPEIHETPASVVSAGASALVVPGPPGGAVGLEALACAFDELV